MHVFQRTGLYSTRFFHAIHLFFIFIGHMVYTIKDVIPGRKQLSYFKLLKTLYHSGASLVIPLCFLTVLLTLSISLSTYMIFERFNMQKSALPIVQDLLTQELMPFLTAFVLCVQSSLNLITTRFRIMRFSQSSEEVILNFILPTIISITVSVFFLQAYILLTIFISLYGTFHYLLNLTGHEILVQLGHIMNGRELLYTILKTLIYSGIVSLTAGYYYYQVKIRYLGLRKAVSRIFTRGTLWLAITSVCWKIINF